MLRPIATAFIVISALSATVDAVAAGGTCAPKDQRSDRLVAHFKAFVGKTDMGGTVEKTTMGVRDVTPSQVALVTDPATCARAAAAYDKTRVVEKRPTYALYVVALGNSYAVEDTVMMQAGFEVAEIFDSTWKYMGVRQIR